MENLYDFIHDDITWCAEENCPNKDCDRNMVNRRIKVGWYSVSNFKGTDMCPLEKGSEEE